MHVVAIGRAATFDQLTVQIDALKKGIDHEDNGMRPGPVTPQSFPLRKAHEQRSAEQKRPGPAHCPGSGLSVFRAKKDRYSCTAGCSAVTQCGGYGRSGDGGASRLRIGASRTV